MKIAIIGAGFSGANIYSLLKKDNHDVVLFEKSRGAGGRCSTRYINDKKIDHGTPFFKVNNKEFLDFCDIKVKENVLKKDNDIYYPTDGINKICSSLIDINDLVVNTKIISCKKNNNKWSLKDSNGISYEQFDKLIITIPAKQILKLDIDISLDIKEKLQSVEYDSIATLMVYSHTLQNLMNPKLVKNKDFKKVVDNSIKYNYQNFSSYLLHLNQELTNQQSFKSKDEIEKYMLNKIFDETGIRLEEDFYIVPHFWKYAFVSKSLDDNYIFDNNSSLAICGDYFQGDNLEASYISSKRLYEDKFR